MAGHKWFYIKDSVFPIDHRYPSCYTCPVAEIDFPGEFNALFQVLVILKRFILF